MKYVYFGYILAALLLLLPFSSLATATESTFNFLANSSSLNTGLDAYSIITATTPNQTWLNFDGTINKNVTLPVISFLSNGNYTFVGSYLKNYSTSAQSIITIGSTNTQGIGFRAGTETNGIALASLKDQTLYSYTNSTGIPNSTLHFGACTYLGVNRSISCYADRTMINVASVTFNFSNVLNSTNMNARIGGINSAFNGSINFAGMFDYELTQNMINNIYISQNIYANLTVQTNQLNGFFDSIYQSSNSYLYGVNNTGVFKSIDNGLTYTKLYSLPSGMSSRKIFVTSQDNILVGLYNSTNSSIAVSSGNQTNFTTINPFFCKNQTNMGIGSLYFAIDEGLDQSIFIGEYGGASNISRCAYIYKSTNNGLTFSMVYNGTNQTFPSRHIHLLKVNPYNGYIYASTSDDTYENSSKLLKSTDNGLTWNTIYNGTFDAQPVVATFSPTKSYFGSDKGGTNHILMTSNDINFKTYNLRTQANAFVYSINYDALTNTVIAGTTNRLATTPYISLYYSNDNGNNFYSFDERKETTLYLGYQEISNFVNSCGYVTDNGLNLLKRICLNNVTLNKYNSVFFLNFNENTGTTAYDSSGNGNNGTISGATWQTDGQNRTLVENVDYTNVLSLFNPLSPLLFSPVYLLIQDKGIGPLSGPIEKYVQQEAKVAISFLVDPILRFYEEHPLGLILTFLFISAFMYLKPRKVNYPYLPQGSY